MPTPETKLLGECWDYLLLKGHFVLRYNNIAVYDRANNFYRKNRYMTPGVSDLIVIPKNDNQPIFIELKSAKGRLSTDQQMFRRYCDDHAVEYEVVRSLDELIALGL